MLTKSLATLDRLTLPVAPAQPQEASTPDVWTGHTASIRGVVFTDDGQFIVSVSGAIEKIGLRKEDNSIRVWDARRGKQVHKLDGFREALDAVSVSPGGRFAVFGHGGHYEGGKWINSVDHRVHLWDIQDNREVYFRKRAASGDSGAEQAEARFAGLDSSVFSTAFAPDRKKVVGVANSGKLVVWETQSGQTLVSGKVIAVARQRDDASLLAPVSFTLSGINCIRFTPDGRWLLVAGADYTARLFDAATGEQLHRFDSHQDIVWAVAATRTRGGRLLGLSGGGDRQVVRGSGFVPGARDYAIRLWDLDSRKEIRRFIGHEGAVQSLAFCPNGRHFLSASTDHTVRLWDIASSALLRTYRGHTAYIRSVAVSPDGRAAVSGGDDCIIRYWRLPAPLQDLVRALDKKDRARLSEILADMDTMGPEVRILYPKLIQLLRRKDEGMSPFALAILRRLGQPDKEWINDLRELLIDPLPAARTFAAESLARLGKSALPALAELRKSLRDAEPGVRRSVVAALANLGKEAQEAAADLEQLIEREKDGDIKNEAVRALGKIDRTNRVVRQRLRDAIAGDDAPARLAALKSLLDLGPESDALEACLKAYLDSASRTLARSGLEKMPLKKSEVPRLTKALENDIVELRLLAVALLGRMGAEAADAKPALMKSLKDKDGRVRLESAVTLAALASADKDVVAEIVPVLIEPLKGVKKPAPAPDDSIESGNNPFGRGFGRPPAMRGGFLPGIVPPPKAGELPQAHKKIDNKEPSKDETNVARARDAIVRIGLPATPALFEALIANKGHSAKERWTRYQIYLTFTALGSKANTVRNRMALNTWANSEQTRAARYGTNDIFEAAFQALKDMRGKKR